MGISNASTPYRARFFKIEASPNEPGRLRINAIIENRSAVAWNQPFMEEGANQGPVAKFGPVLLGYCIFDSSTGLQVLEGDRTVLGNCEPGARKKASMDVQLPPEDGHYVIWISLVEEGVAWFHDRGADFIEMEVTSDVRGISVGRVWRATRAGLRVRRARQLVERALWYPWRSIVRNRSLIYSLVRRDILSRYRGSIGGALWTVLHPLLLMAAYYFVFAVVLKVTVAPGRGGFIFYFLCGMLPWLAFSEAVGRAANVVLDYSGFVKRVVFPLEILPVNLTMMGLATELFALAIFLGALATVGPGIHWTVAYIPTILIPQLLFTAGFCWFLASLGVFLRDTGQVIAYLLTIWFFVTPICYPASSLPQHWHWLFVKNPMYTIVAAYRSILLDGVAPEWTPLWKLWIVGLVFFLAGHAWFFKAKKSFADLI